MQYIILVSFIIYMLLFTYKPQENKEKDTTDHEGSEEIRQEQQYSQRYVYHHFLSQFLLDLLVFYIAILQYSQRYVDRHFLSQLLSDLLVFTLLFCNHKKSSVVKCLLETDRQTVTDVLSCLDLGFCLFLLSMNPSFCSPIKF